MADLNFYYTIIDI